MRGLRPRLLFAGEAEAAFHHARGNYNRGLGKELTGIQPRNARARQAAASSEQQYPHPLDSAAELSDVKVKKDIGQLSRRGLENCSASTSTTAKLKMFFANFRRQVADRKDNGRSANARHAGTVAAVAEPGRLRIARQACVVAQLGDTTLLIAGPTPKQPRGIPAPP
jgi:hypothetical protein